MSIVTFENKLQVVIPQTSEGADRRFSRRRIRCEGGKGIVFEPKSIVDRSIAVSMVEVKAGQSFGPFATHRQVLAVLHKEAKKLDAKKTKRELK
jgi:hypothetical protein